KNNLVGAIVDEVVTSNEVFRYYVENALGVNEYKYFNSGILVMNLDAFRKEKLEEKFIYLLNNYNFGTVAPDQDYLNVLCKGRIHYIDKAWNKMPVSNEGFDEKDLKLVHYNMFQKPWKYEGILYEKYFWETAKNTPYYDFFKQTLANFDDTKKLKDQQAGANLLNYAKNIANDPNNFKNTLNRECECLAEKQHIQMKAIEEICVLEDFLNLLFADESIGSECY
ncbi:MAG: glycosyltransferase family 8 protein, partial [Clostridia bacterium]